MQGDKNYHFTKMTLEEYTRALASEEHIPGGGSVAGLCMSFAISLFMMVLSISVKEFDEDLDNLYKKLEQERIRVLDLVNRDSRYFDELMLSFKMPKNTPEEQQKRKEAIENGYKNAAYVPYQLYKIVCDLEEDVKKYRYVIKSNLESDLTILENLSRLSKANCIDNIHANKFDLALCQRVFGEVSYDEER